MILPVIDELQLFGVHERGVPYRERVVIRITQRVNLGEFSMIAGVQTGESLAVPLRDNFFWFGDGFVQADDWLFVYTCSGTPSSTNPPNSTSKMYSLFWGRERVMFHNHNVVPILLRADGVLVGDSQRILSSKE